MIRSLFIAATGMNSHQLNMDVIANNLANINTTGYKKSRADFQELLYQDKVTPGSVSSEGSVAPTGIQVGLGVKPMAVQKIFLQGDYINTGNPLDFAIEGAGFFPVVKPDGELAYTRSGAFKLDGDGNIVNSNGLLLEPAVNIPPDALNITVGKDGTVSVLQDGSSAPVTVGNIEIAKFVNPGGLRAVGGNLYEETNASGAPITGTPGSEGRGSISQSFLETSNVDIVEEMINLIISQRAYEINSKAVQAADSMLQQANNLKR